MDNLAHTLAGLAIAEAGLRRTTTWGTVTLAIGANLPDVDVLVNLAGDGVDALAFRRGWTHGVLAMVVLPVALATCILAWDRLVPRRSGRPAADGRWLLALAAISVWSHPLLDLLNTYGVRLLMPFSGRWFYGDALFIIDPWLWLALGAGIVVARRRARRLPPAARRADERRAARPARVALAALAVYAVSMAVSSRLGATLVGRGAESGAARRIMVGPVPVTPFRRAVVRDFGDRYETGTLTFGSSPHYARTSITPSGRGTAVAEAAARTAEGAAFLSWSRFPRFVVEPTGDGFRVRIVDLRYADARGRGWASVVVYVPAADVMGGGER